MELNGAVPDHVIWPEPGEMPAGIDRQLDKAIKVLGRDVAKEKKRPRPTLQKASRVGRSAAAEPSSETMKP